MKSKEEIVEYINNRIVDLESCMIHFKDHGMYTESIECASQKLELKILLRFINGEKEQINFNLK